MSEGARTFVDALYPFLQAPSARSVDAPVALLDAVRRSTLDKCADVVALRREMIAEYATALPTAADAMAARFARGARLFAFGNGGSATDADDAAADCMNPWRAEWRTLPAMSLPADGATFSAVSNDVGVEHVFVRQLAALGEKNDIALGISTSGQAPNVIAGLRAARRRGMLTVALTGNDGGAIAGDSCADFCFVARRDFVPRIQEGHATLWHTLLTLVQAELRDPTVMAAMENHA